MLAAVDAIRKVMPGNEPSKVEMPYIYDVGLSIIFLVRLDPEKYKPEIECLLKFLHARQKKHGGWGYYEKETGDTSMTQYGVLSSGSEAGRLRHSSRFDGGRDELAAGHARPQRRIRLPGGKSPPGAVSWGKRKSAAA